MIVVLSVCVLIFLLIWKSYFIRKPAEPPQADGAYPILCHSWLGFVKKECVYERFMSMLTSSLRKNEDLVTVRLGTWKYYVCMNPEDVNLLMNSSLKRDILYDFFISKFGGKYGLLTADVPVWKVHRKLLNPTMNQSVLDTYLTEFNDHSRQLVTLLEQQVGKEPFDQLPLIKQTVLQTVCATIMGVNMNDDKSLIESFAENSEISTSCMTERCRKFYYHGDHFIFNWSKLKKRSDIASATTQKITSEVIRRRRANLSQEKNNLNFNDTSPSRFKSFMDHLLEMGEKGALTEPEIQQEANTFMGAAFETTCQVLNLALLTIGSYPDVQQKIVDELKSVFGGTLRNAEKQDLSKLKYLEATIKETMRLYPVVVGLARILDKELKLGKYTLRAGSRCFASVYHVGRASVWGEDAECFRPDRWLDGSLPRGTGAFAVFGLGRNNCIGSNFAIMLMKIVLCHVVRAYRIHGDVTQLVRCLDIAVTPVSGYHITLQKREIE